MRKLTLHNRGNNKTYGKNRNSEGNSNTLKQGHVADSDTAHYTKII